MEEGWKGGKERERERQGKDCLTLTVKMKIMSMIMMIVINSTFVLAPAGVVNTCTPVEVDGGGRERE